jgi:hypothetical protein
MVPCREYRRRSVRIDASSDRVYGIHLDEEDSHAVSSDGVHRPRARPIHRTGRGRGPDDLRFQPTPCPGEKSGPHGQGSVDGPPRHRFHRKHTGRAGNCRGFPHCRIRLGGCGAQSRPRWRALGQCPGKGDSGRSYALWNTDFRSS